MLLLLSLSEDSLVSLFARRNLSFLDDYAHYYASVASLPKGYLFPRFYLFYDDSHLLPVATFRYQYVDTVRLRLEERETDLGLPNLRRLGWGFAWSVLDPQVLAWSFASRYARRYAEATLESTEENAKINFRILLRVLHTLRIMLVVVDSASAGLDSVLSLADTLRTLGRFPPERYLEIRMKAIRLRREREDLEREYRRLRDTVEILVGTEVPDVEPVGALPECLPYDSTYLIEAQRWVLRAEMARFLPKLLAFGEVWYGSPVGLRRDSSGIGTLYGLRLTLTFDETGRLRVKKERAALRLLKGRREKVKREDYPVDTSVLEEAHKVYDEAKRMYRMGRLDAFTLFKLRADYYTLKLEVLRERIRYLKGRVCPILLPEVPRQYTPSP